jgi:ParB family chromosome partitioning protein
MESEYLYSRSKKSAMAHKTGLGKGLDALIPGKTSETRADNILSIPIDRIQFNPYQPRAGLNPEDLSDLAISITEHGILQPLIVSRNIGDEQYTLVAGERRLRAAQMAGLNSVPAIVRQVTDQEYLELALIENIQRANLTPLETAEAYRQLNEEIAQQVGKSRASITNTIRLLKLSPAVRLALAEGRISEGHARALLALPGELAQDAALQTILRESFTVRQTEDLVQKLVGEHKLRSDTGKPVQSPELVELEERLRNHLGTRVHLFSGKRGGRLVIHYYSEEELNAIITQILKD